MQTFNKFFLALAFLGGSAAAQAAEGGNELARSPLNKSGERVERSESVSGRYSGSTWSQGLGQHSNDHPGTDWLYVSSTYDNLSATHNGLPVAQKNLTGHYDLNQTQAVVLKAQNRTAPGWKPTLQAL